MRQKNTFQQQIYGILTFRGIVLATTKKCRSNRFADQILSGQRAVKRHQQEYDTNFARNKRNKIRRAWKGCTHCQSSS